MGGTLAVLGIGSNKGNSRYIIMESIRGMFDFISDLRMASLYETEPMYVTEQPMFLNTAVAGYFQGSAPALLEKVNSLEALFGRNRAEEQRYGQRSLDIDILLFGNEIISDPPKLIIPHERLAERAFALIPLLELLPDARDPKTGKPYKEFLDALPDQGVMKI